VEWLKNRISILEEQNKCYLSEKAYGEELDVLKLAVKALEEQTEVNVYDKEETYHNCTVQVLTNTVTGQTSVGWWIDNG
jgi:hypothetical protein